MSIVIQNISEDLRASGPHRYVLRINQKRIALFDHNREDGLAECLRKAAIAAEDPHRLEIQDDYAVLAAIIERVNSKV